jgi:hypothetical protein
MAMQMFVLLMILLLAGQWLDNYFNFSNQYFSAFLPILGLMVFFVKMYYDLME